MAHFAELDSNKTVLRVIVVSDDNEADGENWCKNLLGGDWKQTSYNGNIRKNYAGINWIYDEDKDMFSPPQPYPSWTIDDATGFWKAPTAQPDDGNKYDWNESTKSWTKLE